MSKIVYALESLSLPDKLLDQLNTFHLRGLRQLLGMKTTFVRRGNANALVLKKANEYVNALPPNTPPKKKPPKQIKVTLVSEMIQERAATRLGEIIRASPQQLMRQVTLLPGGAEPKYADKRRQGRPKHSWLELTMRRVWIDHEGWNSLDDSGDPNQVRTFDINKSTHVDCIYRLGMDKLI